MKIMIIAFGSLVFVVVLCLQKFLSDGILIYP
jgi:hypothetical protein